jgi:hypothetical protein
MGLFLLFVRLITQRHVFLEAVAPDLLEGVPLAGREMWFQHEGAPTHCGEDAPSSEDI